MPFQQSVSYENTNSLRSSLKPKKVMFKEVMKKVNSIADDYIKK